MLAEDIKPSRLERSKIAIADLLETLAGDRIAIVTFAGNSAIKCPLTQDYAFVRMALADISTESTSRGGTMIGDAIRKAAEETGIEISSIFLLFEGQVWDRFKGFPTMGLVAPRHRKKRLELAKKFADKVKEIGLTNITCHVGFIPDDPKDPVYIGFIEVMKEYVAYCRRKTIEFRFETGQELPSTLKRTINDIGLDNLAINLDPGNLILYGKAHSLDAVEIFGEYVKGMHAKDGLWPNRREHLGIEVPVGEGEVNFPLLIPRLKEKGFKGPITIEREIRGPKQREDIIKAVKFLVPYL